MRSLDPVLGEPAALLSTDAKIVNLSRICKPLAKFPSCILYALRVCKEAKQRACYNRVSMRPRWMKFIVVLLLSAHLAGPLFETVDRWDHFPRRPHDIVLSVTSALTLLAAGFAVMIALRRLMRARRVLPTAVFRLGPVIRNLAGDDWLRQVRSVHSPPVALRI
jgi:hypothetical protein